MGSLYHRLAAARQRLVDSGFSLPEAIVDVDLYARTILGWDRARILTNHGTPVPEGLEPRFSEWIARRARREPSAYIVGSREFWGLEFRVTPAVLIPRPETEFLVEEAVRILNAVGEGAAQVADIGTGCGCIAVSLARECPRCMITASDISPDALAVARGNAERHHVADRITFLETSYLDGCTSAFDVITANPPYVRDGDKPALAPDVRHEPDVALFGGSNGLCHIEGVLDTAVARLRPGGWFVMEFGFGQEDEVRELVAKRPALRFDRVREDLQGLPRTAIIQRM